MKKLLLSFCSVALIASSFARGIQFDTALTWMYNNGLTMYNSSQEFRPNDKITRGETAKFVSKYAEVIGLSKGNNSCDFNDISYYDGTLVPHIIESCKYGLLKGSNGLFMPSNTITEAEAMTLIIRSYEGMQDETTNPWYVNYFNKAKGLGLLNDADTLDSVGNTAITRERLGTWFYALGWKLEQGIIQSKINDENGNTQDQGTNTNSITEMQKLIFDNSKDDVFVGEFNPSTSYRPIIEESGVGFIKVNNKIYFSDGNNKILVQGADIDTFRQVGFFAITYGPYGTQNMINHYGYAIDKNFVYYNGIVLPGADPMNFVSLYKGYALDNKNVYFNGKIVSCADPFSFVVLEEEVIMGGGNTLAKDKNRTYTDGVPMFGGTTGCEDNTDTTIHNQPSTNNKNIDLVITDMQIGDFSCATLNSSNKWQIGAINECKQIDVKYIVKNIGSDDIDSSINVKTKFLHSRDQYSRIDGGMTMELLNKYALKAGSELKDRYGSTINPNDYAPGTYSISITIDPDNIINETDETNNTAVFYFTIGGV